MLTMVFVMMELKTSSAAANRDGKAKHVKQKVSLHMHYIYLRHGGTILKLVGTSLSCKMGKNIYNAHLGNFVKRNHSFAKVVWVAYISEVGSSLFAKEVIKGQLNSE